MVNTRLLEETIRNSGMTMVAVAENLEYYVRHSIINCEEQVNLKHQK